MTSPSPPLHPPGRQLVLYDGVCGLCDRSVQFLLRHDRHGRFTFAPLQGETAAAVRRRWPALAGLDSFVYVRDHGTPGERVAVRSRAALDVLARLGRPWRLLVAPARLVPRPLADAVYDWIARHRYGWFGRFEVCKLPSAEERDRFLP